MKYPQAIEKLIKLLSQLPSVGPKTAERYAWFLYRQNKATLNELATTLTHLQENITTCSRCQMISESDPCPICADLSRNSDELCLVENTQDLIALEATKQYRGYYFVLGGLINLIDKQGPESLNIAKLEERLAKNNVKEMILALNFNVEGETTSLYLTKLFKDKVKITHLAKGLPAGSDLEYADQMTLKNAFIYRNSLN